MMRIIRIFVASSIVSFCSERKRMGALFCEWNNRLVNKSIFLDVKFCEELDNAINKYMQYAIEYDRLKRGN